MNFFFTQMHSLLDNVANQSAVVKQSMVTSFLPRLSELHPLADRYENKTTMNPVQCVLYLHVLFFSTYRVFVSSFLREPLFGISLFSLVKHRQQESPTHNVRLMLCECSLNYSTPECQQFTSRPNTHRIHNPHTGRKYQYIAACQQTLFGNRV